MEAEEKSRMEKEWSESAEDTSHRDQELSESAEESDDKVPKCRQWQVRQRQGDGQGPG